MHVHHVTRGAVGVALLASLASLPSGAEARTSGQRVGSAIAPAFSIRHAAMRPFENVTLVLGVHDDNPAASRDVTTGDAFHFDFDAGTLGACSVANVSSPSAALDASDWSCIVAGQRATVRHDGDGGPWPHADAVFAELEYAAPAASTVVRTGHDVAHAGAFSPADPSAIVLGVSPDIGSVGPPGPPGPAGPVGPVGPEGPTGETGVGASKLLTSARAVQGERGQPPRLIPGLSGSLNVEAGSRLLALTSIPSHDQCGHVDPTHARVNLEIDGVIVASRLQIADEGSSSLLELTEPLAAGRHDVRVLVEKDEEIGGSGNFTACFGDASDSALAGHLLLLEVRQ